MALIGEVSRLKKIFAVVTPTTIPKTGDRTRQHQLVDIVAIAILAVISGADSWVAIETYAQSKREWLETFLLLHEMLKLIGMAGKPAQF